MHVREAAVTEPDAERLLEHYFASRAAGFPAEQGVYRVAMPDAAVFVRPGGVFLLVVDDQGTGGDAAVGCGGIRRIADTESGRVRFEVKHIWLEPETRGRGWADVLLEALEERARELGADDLVLDTNASLTSAARLYARHSYVDVPAYNDNPNATNWYATRLD